jgi:hypothetical protein
MASQADQLAALVNNGAGAPATTSGASSDAYAATVGAAYRNSTDMLAQTAQGLLATDYINRALEGEQARLADLDRKAKTGIHAVRQEYLYTAYMTNYYDFLAGIAVFTVFAALVLIALAAAWMLLWLSRTAFACCVAAVCVAYGIAVLVAFKRQDRRRRYEWGKDYWNADAAKLLQP